MKKRKKKKSKEKKAKKKVKIRKQGIKKKVKRRKYTKRRSKAGDAEMFALLTELFYNRSISLDELERDLDMDSTSIKRLARRLRGLGLISGRISTTITMDLVKSDEFHFCTSMVFLEIDIPLLKQGKGWRSTMINSEEALFDWIKNNFARTERFKGKVIVEEGYIFMNRNDFRIMLKVHTLSTATFFDFVTGLQSSVDCITSVMQSIPVQVLA